MTVLPILCAILYTVAFIFFIFFNQGFWFGAGYLSCNLIDFETQKI